MSRVEKIVNLGAVVVPFFATLMAIVLLWNSWVTAADLVIAVLTRRRLWLARHGGHVCNLSG